MTRTASFLLGILLLNASANAATHRVEWPAAVPTAGGATILTGAHDGGAAGPVRIVRVEIPPGDTVSEVVLEPRREEVLRSGAEVPNDALPLELGTPTGRSAGYAYWVLPEGDYRGHRIAHVAIAAVSSVDPKNTLRAVDVHVATTPAETTSLFRRVPHPRTAAADARALRALLDADPLPASTSAPRDVPPERPTDLVEYVIIAPALLAPTYQELADIKTAEGTPAIVTTVEDILSSYGGNDFQARIRAYIRDLYLYQGLRYVLLGGDTGDIPTRVVRSYFTTNVDVSTDKYYACLDGNWNADGDDLIGEAPDVSMSIPGDDADLYPEVAVGRVPASTVTGADAFIKKWKSYTGYDTINFRDDYQNKFLALGEVLFPDDWEPGDSPALIETDGADIAESTITYLPPVFETRRLYQYHNNPETPGAEPELVEDVIDRINEGFGIIDHVGHGFRTVMSVGDGKLENTDADDFTNTDAYSLLYAVNCTSGAVQFDCIVEHFLLNPIGGAIAAIAATDLDFPGASSRFKYEFFRALFTDDITTFADAFQNADLPFVPTSTLSDNSFRFTYLTFIALGDPAMEIWRASPDTLDLAFAPTMEVGDGTFTVTVTDDGVPVPDVRVTLQKSDGYGVATTDGAGVAVVDFLPETAGPFDITAVVNSYVPAQASATVNGATTAALRVDALTFHDGTAGGGTGNGDNRPDAGESIVVDVTLRNEGSATATGITTTWHATNPFLTVTDSTAASANIPASSMGTILGAYAFSVSASLPDSLRHVVVTAATDLACNEGSWSEETPFSVYQRILDVIALDWSIDGDDGDGVLETGETAEILLTLTNRGEATAEAVVGVGSYTGGLFTFLDDTINFGAVAPGALVQGGPLRLLSTGGGAADVSVDFAVSDAAATDILERVLDVQLPAAPAGLTSTSTAASIRVAWMPPADPDVSAYRVYRADAPGGPYAEVTTDVVVDGTYFQNTGLPGLTAFWYRVAAIDSSGNESGQSDSIRTSTSPPILEGWPVTLPSGESKGSPTVVDVDFNSVNEIVFGWSYPMVLKPNGGDYVDGDHNSITVGVFDDFANGASRFYTSPAVWDLDDDGMNELVFAAWQTTANGNLIVYDASGAIEPGWPKTIGIQPWSTPAVGDVDGDGDAEIFCASGSANDNFSGVLFGFHHDGTEIIDGDGVPGTIGFFHRSTAPQTNFLYGSPALADLDDDGDDEIIYLEKTTHTQPTASTLYVFEGDGSDFPGFPYGVGTLKGSTSSPAVADLDDNGDLEIVIVTENQVVVVNHDGTTFTGWPKPLPVPSVMAESIRDFMTSPAIGDVNGDGNLDIALGWLAGKVYLWTGIGGISHAGFPATVPVTGAEFEQYLHSPIIGNIDGDPTLEIILSSGTDELFAVNANGTIVDGFPIRTAGTLYGSPALWDVDQNGTVNLIVQSSAPTLTIYDFPSVPYLPAEHPWPMFRHNRQKNGWYTTPITVDVDPVPGADAALAAAPAPWPNPFLPRVHVPFVVPGEGQPVRIRVFDVVGREVRRLADGHFPGGRFQVSWDGRTSRGHRLGAGIYFVRTEIGSERFVRKVTMVR